MKRILSLVLMVMLIAIQASATLDSDTTRKDYDPNGSITVFAYDFRVDSADDLVVYEDGVIVSGGYSVSDVGSETGGDVTFDVAPLSTVEVLTLIREVPLTQETAYPAYGPFPAAAHEAALDKLTMIAQHQGEELLRSLSFEGPSEGLTKRTLADPEGGKLLRWKADETGTENFEITTEIVAYVDSFDSIADLRAAVLTPSDGDVVRVLGHTTRGYGGGIFVWNSSSVALDDGGTIIKLTIPTNGSFERQFPAGTGVIPEWWGAIPDGVTNCSPAVESAIAHAWANDKATVQFSDGTYNFFTTVTLVFDVFRAIRFTGLSTAGMIGVTPKGTTITTSNTLTSLFYFTKTTATTQTLYSLEVDHITFDGNNTATSALYNEAASGPSRPFVVRNCNFTKFSKAIQSNINITGLTTGIGPVIITQCNFNACTYSVYSAPDLGAVLDLIFVHNVSENGGRLYFENTGLTGTFNISDNLLEGQTNAIVILGAKVNGSIERNYFEANSGFIMKVTATQATGSSVKVAGNYYTNCSGATAEFQRVRVDNDDDFETAGIFFRPNLVLGKSVLASRGVRYSPIDTADDALCGVNADIRSVVISDHAPIAGLYSDVTGEVEQTPLGISHVERVSGAAGIIYQNDTAFATGDWIVLGALVRVVSGEGGLYMNLYDDVVVSAGNSWPAFVMNGMATGEWVYVSRAVKASKASTGHLHFNWVAQAGTVVDITDTFVYKLATPTTSTKFYSYMPYHSAVLSTVGSFAVAAGGSTTVTIASTIANVMFDVTTAAFVNGGLGSGSLSLRISGLMSGSTLYNATELERWQLTGITMGAITKNASSITYDISNSTGTDAIVNYIVSGYGDITVTGT